MTTEIIIMSIDMQKEVIMKKMIKEEIIRTNNLINTEIEIKEIIDHRIMMFTEVKDMQEMNTQKLINQKKVQEILIEELH